MNSIYIISLSCQPLCYILCIHFRAGKHDTVDTGIEINDPFQHFIPVMMLGTVVLVIDIGSAFIRFPDGYLERLVHVLFAHLSYFRWHRGAEKPDALTVRCIL